jgi:hypothetical protein
MLKTILCLLNLLVNDIDSSSRYGIKKLILKYISEEPWYQ